MPIKATWLSFLEHVRQKPFPNLRYHTVPFAIHSHANSPADRSNFYFTPAAKKNDHDVASERQERLSYIILQSLHYAPFFVKANGNAVR
jgi:hypothetical protein